MFVRMPPFIFQTDEYIEVSVKAYYPFEKIANGNVHLRWYAKLSDGDTPFYRDTMLYRKEVNLIKVNSNSSDILCFSSNKSLTFILDVQYHF